MPSPGSGKSLRIHMGVDADSGLVHTVHGTPGNVADITEGNRLLHGEETDVLGDAGDQGGHKRPRAKDEATTRSRGAAQGLARRKNRLPAMLLGSLDEQLRRLQRLQAGIGLFERRLSHRLREMPACKAVAEIPGVFARRPWWPPAWKRRRKESKRPRV